MQKRIIQNEEGCWVWTGDVDRDGYGRITINKGAMVVHQVMWLLFYGGWGKGRVKHHVCENKRCCNPEHLMELWRAEHPGKHRKERGVVVKGMVTKEWVVAERCKRGHLFDEGNTLIRKNGTRMCRACSRERHRAFRARKKGVSGKGGRGVEVELELSELSGLVEG